MASRKKGNAPSSSSSQENTNAFNIIDLSAKDEDLPEEVRAAVMALKNTRDLRNVDPRPGDLFSLLHKIFRFQEDNVRNQREHLVLLLANTQSMLGDSTSPILNAVTQVTRRTLENYERWSSYVKIQSVCSGRTSDQLLLVCLYLLIWGEAANLRFMPECLCYIFHHMAKELFSILKYEKDAFTAENGFLKRVVTPLYILVKAEAKQSKEGRASYATWSNYDDFNELFWSSKLLPWNHGGFMQPEVTLLACFLERRGRVRKVYFVEHRTCLHIYHSFHRLWIFLVMMLQGLTLLAFEENIDLASIKHFLSLGPTYVTMMFFQTLLDFVFTCRAYANNKFFATRVFIRFLFFAVSASGLTYLYIRTLLETSTGLMDSFYFKIYTFVVGIYTGFLIAHAVVNVFLQHCFSSKCYNNRFIELIKWIFKENYFVGRGMHQGPGDFFMYFTFWVVLLTFKFVVSYKMQIKPLVQPTRDIINTTQIEYSWHDFVSQGNHNALTVASIWAPVVLFYFFDIQIWYFILSAIVGCLIGIWDHLGEVQSIDMFWDNFKDLPKKFARRMVPKQMKARWSANSAELSPKINAAMFAPFWNDFIHTLREEDYLSDREREQLLMPYNNENDNDQSVEWPLFFLLNKVPEAVELFSLLLDNESVGNYQKFYNLKKDGHLNMALREVYYLILDILHSLVDEHTRKWIHYILEDMRRHIHDILEDMEPDKFQDVKWEELKKRYDLEKLPSVHEKVTSLTRILNEVSDKHPRRSEEAKSDVHHKHPERSKKAAPERDALHEVILVFKEFISDRQLREYQSKAPEKWKALVTANEEELFEATEMFNSTTLLEKKSRQIKRLHGLLSKHKTKFSIPRNSEARRRLQFFANSLFMKMPKAELVREMISFSVFTPYFNEAVLYSKDFLKKENEDGITVLFYLRTIFPDEWENFMERTKHEKDKTKKWMNNRLWASYRGQTLTRTVRGMMYYRKALILQSFLEELDDDLRKSKACRYWEARAEEVEEGDSTAQTQTREKAQAKRIAEARKRAEALADLKFSFVVTCQKYNEQGHQTTKNINYLMEKNPALRIAYIDSQGNSKGEKEYYSKLIKCVDKEIKEIYSIKLPGDFKLGEGKPENQNHAIIFTRGHAMQTIDMNQDNYFEEALKMRNLLQEFRMKQFVFQKTKLPRRTILGIREHVFSGSVSSLAWFMSNQETTFVTLTQRVLARPLKVRMHYGHPDVFDRLFHITRGGISKASKTINLSEDIFAGMNTMLRKGSVTHHEYIQVGKGRDLGFNQIAAFECKVASGNGEQVLSRDVYRLGQLLDFVRMFSLFYTSVGYYICSTLIIWSLYAFLYGKAYLALSGVEDDLKFRAHLEKNAALDSALSAEFLFQVGIIAAIPMILAFVLEHGVRKVLLRLLTMQLQLSSVFFAFSLGTKIHCFSRTLLHGGAKYVGTGRGFVVEHSAFPQNYRLYSRSHFVKGMEMCMLLVVYQVYGTSKGLSFILLSFSSWFLAFSWIYAPFIFNPSGFEWQKTVQDLKKFSRWLYKRGDVGVSSEDSWEVWWNFEQEHIRGIRSRIAETLLNLRFFIFQYGVVYHLKASAGSRSLTVYAISWLLFLGFVVVFKFFSISKKAGVRIRLVQALAFMCILGALTATVFLTTRSTIGDVFASALALLPTGWGIISIAAAWKNVLKPMKIWNLIRGMARWYDAVMGYIILAPIGLISWFPFVSTFQSRLLFNQAFSRGLEISQILIRSPRKKDKKAKPAQVEEAQSHARYM